MTTFAWIVLIISVVGFFSVILAKLPSVLIRPAAFGRTKIATGGEGMREYSFRKLRTALNSLWHFILEAKDLKPTPLINQQVQKVKRVFRIRIRQSEAEPQWLPEVAAVVDQAKQATDAKTAEKIYLEAIKHDPNNRQAYEGLGRLYLQEKNYVEAAETFRFLTGLDPRKDSYWSNYGLSLYSTKRYMEAVRAYEKALQINDKIPTRWVNLSLCYEALSDQPRMIKALNRAVELDQRNLNYLMILADAYTKVGNRVRSEEVLDQILKIDPTHRVAREKLMRLRI